jgi:hypothetical protein
MVLGALTALLMRTLPGEDPSQSGQPSFVAPGDAEAELSVARGSGPRRLPALAYCGDSACPTYDVGLERMRRLTRPHAAPGCTEASAGTCGTFRYVSFSDGFGAYTEYYAPDGSFVAASTWADFSPGGSEFGSPPSCTLAPMEVLCGADAGKRR